MRVDVENSVAVAAAESMIVWRMLSVNIVVDKAVSCTWAVSNNVEVML